jgi:hypothetical protein
MRWGYDYKGPLGLVRSEALRPAMTASRGEKRYLVPFLVPFLLVPFLLVPFLRCDVSVRFRLERGRLCRPPPATLAS